MWFNFSHASNADLLSQGQSVVKGILTHTAYSNPPVDPALLKAALDGFAVAIGDALDGGKKARVERDRRREEVVRMLRTLAHYVESACNDDIATFLASGFGRKRARGLRRSS